MNRDYTSAKTLISIAEVITWLGIVLIIILTVSAGLSAEVKWGGALILFGPMLIAAGVILLAVQIAGAQIHTAENTAETAQAVKQLLDVMRRSSASSQGGLSDRAVGTGSYVYKGHMIEHNSRGITALGKYFGSVLYAESAIDKFLDDGDRLK